MTQNAFDPKRYYASYPKGIILRPGYPARAQWKSTLMWNLYGKAIMRELGGVNTYADIGGCFGFGANAMAFHISKTQGKYPETKVFEISSEFATVGKQLFPYIEFVLQDFCGWNGAPKIFDLVTLFDVVEHLESPEEFLSKLVLKTRLALLKIPIETFGEWWGGKPRTNEIGKKHSDGHINFFTLKSFLDLLEKSHLEILGEWRFVRSIVPIGAERVLKPESPPKSIIGISKSAIRRMAWLMLPSMVIKKIHDGGNLLCLVSSKKTKGP